MTSFDIHAARETIERFDPAGVASYEQAKAAILALLRDVESPTARTTYEPGHLTASAIVLSPDRSHLLLVHHKRLGRWLQPGGHLEASDATLEAAARREVLEEASILVAEDGSIGCIGIDVHEIPAARGEPAHLHHDVLFAFLAPSLDIQVSAESHAVAWVHHDAFAAYEPDAALARTAQRAFERLGRA